MTYDFGYAWPFTHGHLVICLLSAAGSLVAWHLHRKYPALMLGVVALWSLAGFTIVQTQLGLNEPIQLPGKNFLAQAKGTILDIGCGSGRSTAMAALAAPSARIIALDNFSAEYIRGNGPDLLRRNLRVAGVESRVEIKSADMRQLPFSDGSMEDVVSTYAIDHVPAGDIPHVLEEVNRVLQPGGQFLLMIMQRDNWMRVAYPWFLHGKQPGDWEGWLRKAGFAIQEEGSAPATKYFVARKVARSLQ